MKPWVLIGLLLGNNGPAPWGLGRDVIWRNIGPGGGGWIQSIAADPLRPDVLHVGCDVGGYYYSEDRGQHYVIRNAGLHDYYIETIAVHPRDPNIVLLGTPSGIHKTTDGGLTWRWIRNGFPPTARYSYTAPIGALCFDPSNPQVVYAGIGRPREDKLGSGHIYKSTDCGESWKLVSAGQLPEEAIVSDLEVNPHDSNTILAATTKGLFRSEDGGTTWSLSSDGLCHLDVREVAIAPSNSTVVYCTLRTTARDDEPWNGGVYRSDDGGKSWVARCEGLGHRVGKRDEPAEMTSNYKEIVVDPRDENVVYVGDWAWVTAGVYKTTDGGKTWTRVSQHHGQNVNMDYGWLRMWGPSVECLTISQADPNTLYFGTSGHVFVTEDAGATWKQRYCQELPNGLFRGNGLEVTCCWDVVFDPHDPKRLYFCYFDIGLLISEDGGETFRRSFEGMKHSGNCFTVAVDPVDRSQIWACTGQWATNVGDVCRSRDRGESWEVVGRPETGLPIGQTKILRLDPTSSSQSRRLLVTCNGHGFFESNDSGDSWHCINGNLPQAAVDNPRGLLMNPNNPRHLRVALGGSPVHGSGVYETADGGKTWHKLNQDTDFADIWDFVADPQNFDILYICQRELYDRATQPPVMRPGGLFKSVDGGRTWTRLYDYHFVNCVAVSPTDSNILYLGTTDHPYHDNPIALGVLKSTDGGKTWTQENLGLTSLQISFLTVDPRDPSRLYAGTGGNSVFVGTDRRVRK